MKLNSFFYNVKQGVKNIWRNRMFSIASMSTMAACIFIFGVFYAILMNVNSMVRTIEEDVGITVLFNEGTSEERIAQIGEEIKANEHVTEISYTSAEEAWENFQTQYFAEHPELAESFSQDNPLANSASYTVRVDQIENQSEVVAHIEGIADVRQVNQSAAAAKTLTDFNSIMTIVSVVIVAILLVVSVFLIANTVSIGINVRRREIAIMKLIGATDGFVRAPFIVEGAIIGLVGAAIPLLVFYLVYNKLVYAVMERLSIDQLSNSLPTANQVFAGLVPVGLALGLGIGLVGSILMVRKHLKV